MKHANANNTTFTIFQKQAVQFLLRSQMHSACLVGLKDTHNGLIYQYLPKYFLKLVLEKGAKSMSDL